MKADLQNASLTFETVGDNQAASAPRTPIVHFDLVRLGANSLFGNIEIRLQGQPRSQPLGVARGVGVYTEIDRRSVNIALSRPPAPGEHLEITFTDDDTAPGKALAKLVL